MKFRSPLRQGGNAAQKMTVRVHVPWPLRAAVAGVVVVGAAAAGAWWEGARRPADRPPVAARAPAPDSAPGNPSLAADQSGPSGNPIDSRAVMESATVRELGEQVARLEAENARLKDDVAFFDAATADRQPPGAPVGSIAIRRFQVTQDKATRSVRYRLLLTQDSKATRPFEGELQLVLTIEDAGKAVTISLPANPASSAPVSAPVGEPMQFQISFRSYKRMDGSFGLGPQAVLKAVQARIVERGGAVRAQQVVTVG